MKNAIKYLLFSFLAIVIFLPEYYLPKLEKETGFSFKPLGGVAKEKNKPVFWPRKFLDGTYQEQYADFVRDKSAIRNTMVRFRNQIDYDIFRSSGNLVLVPGKNEMLFQKSYAEASIGVDYIGKKSINEKVEKLKYVFDYFEKKGTRLMVLLPPGKPNIYPENLPDVYQQSNTDSTNLFQFNEAFRQIGIPFLDFSFLNKHESLTGLPVYPQHGLHWNYLGVALTTDSLSKFITKSFSMNSPSVIWADSIPVHNDFEAMDFELLRSMNLARNVNQKPMPYPIISFSEIPDSLKPRAVVVGDSYYHMLLKKGYHEALFQSESPFWEYFYRQTFKQGKAPKPFSKKTAIVMEKLKESDLIILSCSEMLIPIELTPQFRRFDPLCGKHTKNWC